MVKFQVGDRVEFNQSFGTRSKGDKGTVTSVDLDDTCTLEMDEKNKQGQTYAQPYMHRLTKCADQTPKAVAAPRDILRMIAATSKKVGSRNRDAILKSLMEEVGELATEISIEDGTKKREPSPDGVGGESIDVLVVIVDLLHLTFGEKMLHSEAFLDKVQAKLNKWEGKNVQV